jgi:PAS domain-containing protein
MTNPATDGDQAESEQRIQELSERVAELEHDNMQLDEVLSRNTRMFEALLCNGAEGITLTGPDRRIVRVIKGLTGIDPASLTGRPIESLAVPEDRQCIVDAYGRLLQGDCGKIAILVRVTLPDGAIALHRATLTDMLDNPNVQGIVWNYSTYPFLE